MKEVEKAINEWIIVEIWCFYMYIVAAAVFLLWIQIRYYWGTSDLSDECIQVKQGRTKNDPLTFYKLDIDWFSKSFIMAILHFLVIMKVAEAEELEKATPHDEMKVWIPTYIVLAILCFTRVLMAVGMPLVNQKREIGQF